MRAAVDAISALRRRAAAALRRGQRRAHQRLWDDAARRAASSGPPTAARDAGSLQLLDTALWIMSLAELYGGTPAAGRAVHRAGPRAAAGHGYDAENVRQRRAAGLGAAPRGAGAS